MENTDVKVGARLMVKRDGAMIGAYSDFKKGDILVVAREEPGNDGMFYLKREVASIKGENELTEFYAGSFSIAESCVIFDGVEEEFAEASEPVPVVDESELNDGGSSFEQDLNKSENIGVDASHDRADKIDALAERLMIALVQKEGVLFVMGSGCAADQVTKSIRNIAAALVHASEQDRAKPF